MNITIQIHGREAIPVRAIPFLTDWTVLSPDTLADSLSGKGNAGEIRGLTAYQLVDDAPTPIKRSLWADISAAIESITDECKAKSDSYAAWQQKTVQALPEQAFVWLDEFEPRFNQSFLDEDGGSTEQLIHGEHALLGLDYSPLMTPELGMAVMQGFNTTAPARVAPTARQESAMPLQRGAAQNAAILAAIRSMNIDPLAVPKNLPGKPGIKAKVRSALKGSNLFVGTTIFDRAWEQLRARKDIVDLG